MEWTRRTGIVVALTVVTAAFMNVVFHRLTERSEQVTNGSAPLLIDIGSPVPRLLADSEATPLPGGSVLPATVYFDDDDQASPSAKVPEPVPVPADAVPLNERPGSDPVRDVIEDELANSSREERDIWYEELKSIPAGVVRDLLQVRKQLRELPRALHTMEPMPSAPRVAEVTAEPVSQSRRIGPSDWSATIAALEQACDIGRHNLANSTTPGYRRVRVVLADTYGIQWDDATEEPAAPWQPAGCRVADLLLDHEPGSLQRTGRMLDLAIDGDGFFVGRRHDKLVYSRCGALVQNAERQLCLVVSTEPIPLDPPVTIPPDAREVQITGRGVVQVVREDGADPTTVGQISLARFPSPARLRPSGGTLLQASERSGVAEIGTPTEGGCGILQQGFLERSNVEPDAELESIEKWQSVLKSFPTISRPLTASGQDPRSR